MASSQQNLRDNQINSYKPTIEPSRISIQPKLQSNQSQQANSQQLPFSVLEIQCERCQQVPIPQLSALECTECGQIYCNQCQDLTQIKCAKCGKDNFTSKLSNNKEQQFGQIEVSCQFKDQGCQSKFLLIDKEIIKHEDQCLEQCDMCTQKIPSSVKGVHQCSPLNIKSINSQYEDENLNNQEEAKLKYSQTSQQPQIIEAPSLIDKNDLTKEEKQEYSYGVDTVRTRQVLNEIGKEDLQQLNEKIEQVKNKTKSLERQITVYLTICILMFLFLLSQVVIIYFGGVENMKEMYNSFMQHNPYF